MYLFKQKEYKIFLYTFLIFLFL